MKKGLSLVLAFSLILSNLSIGAFASEQDTQKAEILSKLNLMSGFNGDLQLNKSLTRAEASTFIVKLLGVQNELSKSVNYKSLPFSDLEANAWYLPYVEYCYKNGIIKGMPGGTLQPNAAISEKAFLTMLLKGLNYTDSDFNWNTVFAFAYAKGIVTDDQYIKLTTDNTKYLREQVAGAFYNALVTPNKDTLKKPIEVLASKSIVDSQIAQNLGILKVDQLATKIESVKAIGEGRIEITLNEEVQKLPLTSFEVKTDTGVLAVNAVTQDGKLIKVDTAVMRENVNYTLNILNAKDLQGFTSNLTEKFTGYKPVEISSNYFKIKKVESVNKNQINVFFTQPVNISAELPLFYEISANGAVFEEGRLDRMAIAVLGQPDNAIALTLKSKVFSADTQYTLKIKGDLSSNYGAKLNDGLGDTMTFWGNASNATGFSIGTVQVVDKQYVDITFTNALDPVTALNPANYTLVNKTLNISFGAALDVKFNQELSKGKMAVRVKYPTFNTGDQYELTLNNVYAVGQVNKIEATKIPIYAAVSLDQGFKLDTAIARDKGTVVLYFNRSLTSAAAAANNYIFTGGLTVASKKYDPTRPNELVIYLNSGTQMNTGASYTMTILPGIMDYVGTLTTQNIEKVLTGPSVSPLTPAIVEAKRISSTQVLATFNTDLDATSAGTALKYSIEYTESSTTKTKNPSNASLISANQVILTFDSIPSGSVNVKTIGVADFSNQYLGAQTSSGLIQQ